MMIVTIDKQFQQFVIALDS